VPDPTLRIKLEADDTASKKIAGLGRTVLKAAGDIKRQLVTAFKVAAVGAGALAAAGAAVGFAMKKTADSFRDAALEADGLAVQFGLTAEEASGYVRVAELADVKSNELVAAFQRLSRGISGVKEGTDPTSGAFQKLGVEAAILEGELQKPEEALLAIADRFAEMPDGADKVTLAYGALGDSGKALIPLLNQGSASIKEQLDLVKELGATIDDEAVRAAAEYDKQIKILGFAFEGLRNELAQEVVPVLIDLSKKFLEFFRKVRPQIVAFIRFVPAAFSAVVKFIRETFEKGGILEVAGQVFDGVLGLAKALGIALIDIAPDLWEPLIQGLASMGGRLVATFTEEVSNPLIDVINEVAFQIRAALSLQDLPQLRHQFENVRENISFLRESIRELESDLTSGKIDASLEAQNRRRLERKKATLRELQREEARILAEAGGGFTILDRIDTKQIRAASRELGKASVEGFGEAIDQFGVALDEALADVGEGLAETAPNLVQLLAELKAAWVQAEESAKGVNEELDKTPRKVEEATESVKTFGEGFREQLEANVQDLQNMGQRGAQVANEVTDLLGGALEDKFFTAIENGFRDMSGAWKDLLADILQGLAKIAARQAIMSALGAGLGAIPLAQGGIIPGGRTVPSFQAGGIAREPMFRVGDRPDRVPEAVVPLPNGRAIPVEFAGGGQPAGGATNVSVSLSVSVSALDQRGVDELLFGRKQTIRNIVEDGLARSGAFRDRVGRAR
jgi:archaellum component FlaC